MCYRRGEQQLGGGFAVKVVDLRPTAEHWERKGRDMDFMTGIYVTYPYVFHVLYVRNIYKHCCLFAHTFLIVCINTIHDFHVKL